MKVLKILLKILLIILFLLVITNKALAVTEFKVTVKSSGGDYTSLSAAENGLDYTGSCDLTSTSYLTAAYDGAVGDPTGIIDAEAVTWDGGSGNIIHVTTTAKSGSNAFFIYVSSGTLEDNDVIDDDDGNTITVNGTPDTAQISIECYAMQDTTGVTIIGWTTDADHYIKVYTPTSERHNGTYDTSKYRIEVTNSIPITISEEYVKIDGLQLQLTGTDGGGERNGIYTSGTVAPSIEISNNIIVGVMSNISNSAGISIRNATATKIWNNIIYGWNYNNGVVDAGIYVHAGTLYIYNNTVRDCRQGIRGVGSPVTVKNNIVNDIAEGEWNGSFNSASTHNITDDIDALVNWGATWSTGTATSYSANKLVNSGDTFVTDGVQVGSIVRNNTDGTLGYVTAVDSETTLSLNSDLFNNGNENYTVYTNMYGEVTFENEGTNDLHLGSADTVAKDKGTDLSGDGNLPFSDDIDGESRSGTWDVGADEFDSDPPTISLTPLSPDPTNDNTPSLTGTASEAKGTVSNVQYQMDGTGETWTNCTADNGAFNEAVEPFTCSVGSALTDGSHTIYVRATDSNGNTTSGGSESADTFTIDITAPTISVTPLSPDPNNDNTPSITGTATDATTVLTAIQYQVDSGSWTTCTANDGTIDETSEPFTCTIGSALTDGSHTIYIRATDSATNTTQEVNYGTDTFTIDTTPPSISLTSYTPDPGNDNTPSLTGTATDSIATVASVQYQMDGTGETWTNCTANDGTFNGATEAFTCTVSPGLSDGSHTIYVRATDSTGNTTSGGSEQTDTFVTDITAPTVGSISINTGDSYTSSASVTLTISAQDATSGLYQMIISEDPTFTGDSWEAYSTSKSFTLSTGDGLKTVYIKFKDQAQNESSNYSDTITLDTGAPTSVSVSSITENPDSNYQYVLGANAIYYNTAASSGSFIVTAIAQDTISGIEKLNFPSLTGFSATNGGDDTSSPYSWTYNWSNSSSHNTSAQVTAYNNAGLTTQATFYVYLDTTTPTGGSITYTDGYYDTASVSLTVLDGTDSQSGLNTQTRTLQRRTAALSNDSCQSYGSWTDITSNLTGSYPNFTDTTPTTGYCYQYRYQIQDNVLNEATYTTTNTVKLDTQAPSTPSISSITPDSSSQLTILAQAQDDVSGLHTTPYWFRETTANPGATSSTSWQASSTFTDTDLSPNTQYTYQVKVRDNSANESSYSEDSSQYTLANPPNNLSLLVNSPNQVTASWGANNNPTATEYYCENITQNTNSGWVSYTSWISTNLTPQTSYTFRVKARNQEGTETDWTSSQSTSTSPGGPTPFFFVSTITTGEGNITQSLGGQIQRLFPSGQLTRVIFEKESVKGTVIVKIEPKDKEEIINTHPLPKGLQIASDLIANLKAIQEGEELDSFEREVEVTFYYDDSQIQESGLNENTLNLYYWDDEEKSWKVLSQTRLDTSQNTITALALKPVLVSVMGGGSLSKKQDSLDIEGLKARIREIQEEIIRVLTKLIQLIQERITQRLASSQ